MSILTFFKLLAALLVVILLVFLLWIYLIFEFDKIEDKCEIYVWNKFTHEERHQLIKVTEDEKERLGIEKALIPSRGYYEVRKCLYNKEYRQW